jgi:type VI protein secretion system component Hcp
MKLKLGLSGIDLLHLLRRQAIVVVLAGIPLCFSHQACAGDAGYIRIIGAQGAIEGASKEPGHVNWIAISAVVAGDLNGDALTDREASAPSVSELAAKPAEAGHATGGGGAGRVSMQDATASNGTGISKNNPPRESASGQASGKRMHKPLVIVKEVDKASPLLLEACASGKHFAEVDVDLVSAGHPVHYKLTDVLISSDQKSSGGDRPTETLSFTYQKIEMTQ